MKYITADQFLSSDKKVQDEVMKWWKPEEYDLVKLDSHDYIDIISECYGNEIRVANEEYHQSKYQFIPLLTLQQLIDYIESRVVGGVEIFHSYHYDMDSGYEESGSTISNEVDYFEDEKFEYHGDLLQAMWKLAQRISK